MTQVALSPEETEDVRRMLGSAGWRVLWHRFIAPQWKGLTLGYDHAQGDHRYWQGRKNEAELWLTRFYTLAGFKESPITAYPLGDVSPLEERSREAAGPDTGSDASAQKETDPWPTEPSIRMAPPPRVTHPV